MTCSKHIEEIIFLAFYFSVVLVYVFLSFNISFFVRDDRFLSLFSCIMWNARAMLYGAQL